jgi:hypothetical protein
MRDLASLACLALAVPSAGCVYAEGADISAPAPAGLAEALAGRTARPAVSCVPLRELGGNRSVGEESILFGGNARRIWLNRLPAGCPGLEPGRALMVRTVTGQLCRGDIVTVFDPLSGTEFGGCGLGDFTPWDRIE